MKSLTEHLWFEVPGRRGFVKIGASGGTGAAFLWSNAGNMDDIGGPFKSYNVNTPIVTLSFSWAPNASGETIFAITVSSPSAGLSVSGYPTYTTKLLGGRW